MSDTGKDAIYDAFFMGRSCIDLYSNDIGASFVDIKSFAAFVGGSPTNMSVGCQRLGLNTVLLTAFGEDLVGDFVKNFLDREGVETRFCPRKPGKRTSAVILGIEPPDKFPLVYYRDNCADIELNIDDVVAAPIKDCRVFEFAGTNLSKDPSRSATVYGAEIAKMNGISVIFDLDFRPDQWLDPLYFGVTVRSVLHTVDIVIGTADEINAVMIADPDEVKLTHSQISDARVAGDTQKNIKRLLKMGPKTVIEKIGEEGCRIHQRQRDIIDVQGFPVEIKNILGAGDAFGAGFIYGYLKEWKLQDSVRFGNACGAIVVTRPGCSNSMPTYGEVMAFVDERGGL